MRRIAIGGHFRGIAMHESFGSIVAEVAEISVGSQGLRVHRVDCAVDCGVVINPNTIVAPMESGIAYGLSAALFGTLKRGRVEQTNFDTYPMLRIGQMPKVTVSIIEGADKPGRVGEPGTARWPRRSSTRFSQRPASACARCRSYIRASKSQGEFDRN